MSTGMADLRKAGIKTERDLIRFSWEESNMFTKAELAELDKLLKGGTVQ